MKVISIDPGFGRCGIAVVEKKSGKDFLVDSTCVETKASAPFEERLATVVEECRRWIQKHAPNAVALERLYFNTNQTTAMRVAEVRGAIIQTANEAGLPVFEYTPSQIKVAAAGNGRADKAALTRMVRILLGLTKVIAYDDEYDAIAVGITHLAHAR